MKEAVLSLGSNMLNREENLKNAISALKKLPGTVVKKISSIYETKPFQVAEEQADYLNCCVKLVTELSPQILLGACLGIEASMGRLRPYKNASRIIDLDLLLYQDYSVCSKLLTLPHPRIKERAFVMVPLSDLYENKIALGLDFNKAFRKVGTNGVIIYNKILK